jgi:hypothetical protein
MSTATGRDTIRIMRLPVEGEPEVVDIQNKLEAMQAQVGGLIEPVELPRSGLDLFLNEEGVVNGAELNPHALRLWEALNGIPATRFSLQAGQQIVRAECNNGYGYRGDAYVARFDSESGHQVDLTDDDVQWLKARI